MQYVECVFVVDAGSAFLDGLDPEGAVGPEGSLDPESVKIFWTLSCQLFCSRVFSSGGLIHATVGSVGGSGCRLNRSGLRA